MSDKYKKWQFVHIYGAPLETKGKYTKKMNKNPEIGSLWKGKIYIKIEHDDNPNNPKTKVMKMEKSVEEDGNLHIEKSVFWTINTVLHEAYFLPENEEYKILINVEHRSSATMQIVKS